MKRNARQLTPASPTIILLCVVLIAGGAVTASADLPGLRVLENGRFLVYERVNLNTGRIASKNLRGWWYNPRTGEAMLIQYADRAVQAPGA